MQKEERKEEKRRDHTSVQVIKPIADQHRDTSIHKSDYKDFTAVRADVCLEGNPAESSSVSDEEHTFSLNEYRVLFRLDSAS